MENASEEQNTNRTSAWISYSGASKDFCYTFIEVQTNACKLVKAMYRCRICRVINCIGNGPSNIRRHLLAKHSINSNEIAYKDWKPDAKQSEQVQPKLTFQCKKYSTSSSAQNTYVQKCAEWIAHDNHPLSIVEDIGFRNLLKEISPRINIISRQTVLRRLKTMEATFENKIIHELSQALAIAVTSDVWTDSS